MLNRHYGLLSALGLAVVLLWMLVGPFMTPPYGEHAAHHRGPSKSHTGEAWGTLEGLEAYRMREAESVADDGSDVPGAGQAVRSGAQTGRLYGRPDSMFISGYPHTIEYVNPGTLVGLFKAPRSRLVERDGPIGPMRELIRRRDTEAYWAALREHVASAGTPGRILTWNIEPIPDGKGAWSDAERQEWIDGQLQLIADARSLDADVKQAVYRVPFTDPVREARVVYARRAATGAGLPENTGASERYWADPARQRTEEALYQAYLENMAHFAPVVEALDFISVHGYQQALYPPWVWADAAFSRAAQTGKPILLWLSPRERGRSDSPWVSLAGLDYLAGLARQHEASAVWWINGVDYEDHSAPMAERLDLVAGHYGYRLSSPPPEPAE